MNTNIPITVRERVPTVPEEYSVISHNTDYTVTFDFDSDWTAKYKTVYFVAESGEYTPVVMEGDTCAVPEVKGDCRYLFIGVQEGTAEKPGVLKTSRACCLKIRDSITDMIGAPIADPAPSVYEQIMAMLQKITAPTWSDVKNKPFSAIGDGLSVDEAGVLSAQGGSGGTPNAVQYVAQTLTDEQKAQARENIGAGTSSFSGSYNDLTDKPTIPEVYTLPVATSDVLGGVKPAAKTDAMTSAVGVDADGKLWSAAGGGTLPKYELIWEHTITAEETAVNLISITSTEFPKLTKCRGLVCEITAESNTKISSWVKLSINNIPVAQFTGSTKELPRWGVAVNRLFGRWIGSSVYNPQSENDNAAIVIPSYAGVFSYAGIFNTTFDADISTLSVGSYIAWATEGQIIRLWGCK